MLAFMDVPTWLEEVHEEARRVGKEIFKDFESSFTADKLQRDSDLIGRGNQSIYIAEGIFKFIQNGRLVRLYSPGEWFCTNHSEDSDTQQFISDFGTEVAIIPSADFTTRLHNDAEVKARWNDYLALEHRLLLGLCGLYANEEVRPDIKLERFEPGDSMIRQGEGGNEIYELVEGEASVHVDGVVVGRIRPGEFFGEMSLLIDEPRAATVTAATSCCAHVITQSDFERITRCRPGLALTIAKTLALRIKDLNLKLLGEPETDLGPLP